MSNSTRTATRTPAQQFEDLVADHARVSAELDRVLAEQRYADRERLRIDALADALDLAEDGGASVMPIARIRDYIGREHLCRLEGGGRQ